MSLVTKQTTVTIDLSEATNRTLNTLERTFKEGILRSWGGMVAQTVGHVQRQGPTPFVFMHSVTSYRTMYPGMRMSLGFEYHPDEIKRVMEHELKPAAALLHLDAWSHINDSYRVIVVTGSSRRSGLTSQRGALLQCERILANRFLNNEEQEGKRLRAWEWLKEQSPLTVRRIVT